MTWITKIAIAYGVFVSILVVVMWIRNDPKKKAKASSPRDLDLDPYRAPLPAPKRLLKKTIEERLRENPEKVSKIELAAHNQAKRRGMTAEEYLEKDLQRALENDWPRPDCPSIDHLRECGHTGEIDADTFEHIQQCVECRGELGVVLIETHGQLPPSWPKS
jgi:hypothetical protein